MKAAAYCRFSSDNQREESIDAQLRAIKEYAEKNNIEIVKVYADEAKSATTDDRPQFLQMVKDSEIGIFEAVIVHKLDRFARNRYDSAFYKRQLKKNGVIIISVLEQLDDSPESIILESVLEGMAEYYSKNLAREVMKGLKENAFNAKFNGGIPPLGYNIVEGEYHINNEEAEAIKLIFDLYAKGYGYRHIIDELNLKGYKTKNGNSFSKNSLYGILRNEKYTGKYIFNKGTKTNHRITKDDVIIIENAIPAIIDKDLFEKVQKKINERKIERGANTAKRTYLLSGLVYCGICGSKMVGCLSRGKYVTYRCNKKDRTKQCTNKDINKDSLEVFIVEELNKKIFDPEVAPILAKLLNEENQKLNKEKFEKIAALKKNYNKIESQIKNIVDAIAEGMYQPIMKEKMRELEDKKNEILYSLSEIEKKKETSFITPEIIMEIFNEDREIINSLNNPQKIKEVLKKYIKKIIVYPTEIKCEFYFWIGDDFRSLEVAASGVEPPTLRV
ncbi:MULTISPECIES: recombinase family protein [Thermoanaerobacterium]|uniref:Recombinase n=2 Tax=Thermoanaerobacterium TaxID=28895 RepID=W9EBZ1_9THEO|nr:MULTISPECIES: recombinase family protein [Thermoanaerobacterium]AFK85919.1 Recombinase [Thermoanaerobacterium saccharolyticum JW/SL-YS485]ETO38741.1 recombinase [Thermoanaerobacterium aotearoense SCUT27]